MRKLYLSLLALLPSLTLAATDDLLSLYHIAQTQDPTVRIAKSTEMGQQTLLPQARGALLPQLSTTAKSIASYTESQTSSADIEHSHSLTLNLSQSVFNFQAWYAYLSAQDQVDVAKMNTVVAEQDLMLRLTTTYFSALQARSSLHFQKAKKEALSKELEQAQQRLNVGLAPITDLHDAQARYDAASADVIQAESYLDAQYDLLQTITGQMPNELAGLHQDFELQLPAPAHVDEWVTVALQNNPSLKSAELSVDSANQTLKLKRAAHYPSVAFTASRGKNRLGTVHDPESAALDAWNGTLTINMELFSGGTTQAQANQAYYDAEVAKENYTKVKRNTELATNGAYRDVVSAISRTKALKQAVVSSRTALKAAKAAYEVGTRTSVDVLDSITKLYANEDLYAQATHNYVVNQLRLKQAAGSLSEQDLVEVNQLLVKDVKA